jgi:hypothetical protein
MLKLRDLEQFQEFIDSGGWADAFRHAGEDLRLEMLGLVEQLLDTADAADKAVGEILFAKDGLDGDAGGEAASALEAATALGAATALDERGGGS